MPKPAGFRFVHTHVVAGADLTRGTYTGQAAPVDLMRKLVKRALSPVTIREEEEEQ